MLLTDLATEAPPRIGHLIARCLGFTAAHSMFCKCCIDSPMDVWGYDEETEEEDL